MNVALWIVQGLLALAFVAAGSMKLFAYEKFKARSEKKGQTGISRGLTKFIGIAELAGGLGLILPAATGITPWLTAWAAIGLAVIMLLATGFHVRRHESPTGPAVLFLLAVIVAFGRISH